MSDITVKLRKAAPPGLYVCFISRGKTQSIAFDKLPREAYRKAWRIYRARANYGPLAPDMLGSWGSAELKQYITYLHACHHILTTIMETHL